MLWSLRSVLVCGLVLVTTSAIAADRIRLAVQRTGTLAWELEVIRRARARPAGRSADRDHRACLDRSRQDRAQGRLRDMMLSDWLWGRARALAGDALVFYPSSSTLRGRDGTANSPVGDSHGPQRPQACGRRWAARKKLAIAAGACAPLRPRSQAAINDRSMRTALLSEKALQGEHDATLTF